jgi:hypothetical protein
MDFNELRSNSPSGSPDFSIERKGDLYLLKNEVGKKMKEPFGFCDGESIYINTFFYNPTNGKAVYAKVLEEGRLLAWFDHYLSAGEAAAVQAAFGLIGYAVAKSGDLDCIVLDLKTGIITPLTKTGMERVLKEDQELLNGYQQTGRSKDEGFQMSLVKKFNSRHFDF